MHLPLILQVELLFKEEIFWLFLGDVLRNYWTEFLSLYAKVMISLVYVVFHSSNTRPYVYNNSLQEVRK